MNRAPVIAVSGHPGSGKTTLVAALRGRFGAPSLNHDDYETFTAQPAAAVRRWMAAGSDYDEIDLATLESALEAAAAFDPRPPLVLFDSLLGRAHQATGRLIDLSLWIDTPADIALARKVAMAAESAIESGEEAAFTGWLKAWLGHYQGFIADTYHTQTERVRPRADVVLDGRMPAEALADAAAAVIGKWLEESR